MEVITKKRPPFVYFAIFVIGLAVIAITVGLFKTEVVDDVQDPVPVEREDLGE